MTKPMVLVALLLAVTLIHLVTAGTQLNGELGELSSTIEELKSTFTRELRNNGANLTLNVTALEASVLSILDAMGNITSKLDAATADLDATKAKVDANKADLDATKVKVDANTVKVDANTAAVATKCDESKCGSIETKVDTNTGKVDTNTAAIATKCDDSKCGTIETKVGNMETCFSDKSSSSCPASASGKTGIKAAITDLEEGPMFSCTYQGDEIGPTGNGGTLTCPAANDAACIITYTKCDVNQGITTGVTTDTSVDMATGKFTVPKAGRYRLTFMAVAKSGTNRKAIVSLMNKKKSDSSIVGEARALVQNKLEDSTATNVAGNFYATISLDVIRDLAKDDEIYIHFNIGDGALAGKATNSPSIIFTGQLVSLMP